MRTLDRYLLREFSMYLALGLMGFITIFIVVDVFEKIDVFLDHHAPFDLVFRFYVYRVPEVVVRVLPVALLMATFLALGQLNKFGELTAMRAAGLSLVRILAPIFGLATVGVIVALAISEVLVPTANQQRDRIYDEQIQKIQRDEVRERADVTYLGAGGRIFYMRLYLVGERRMHEVSLQEFTKGNLRRRIDAAEATWDGKQWVFSSGYLRTFEDGKEKVEPFTRMSVKGLPERPEDFAKETRQPDEMSYPELRSYVERLRASGSRVSNYLVDLHLKLAFPLVNLIVVMIGAAIATRLRLQSNALGFGLSVTISFLYYAFMRTGQALGHNGALPPYLAAWLGDLVFGTVGLTMMIQAQRR
ncbi:MAG TPA: LPS export ABC transporter permease LptG [Candidatus Eisenbacteria bacterium]|nr:LPS export ABC transporter permease LptG [Candidatus Eisenbacteria bacterium]